MIGSEPRFALAEATGHDFDIGLNRMMGKAPGVAVADVISGSTQATPATTGRSTTGWSAPAGAG